MKLMLLFPNRGNPPAEQEGYTRESGNPFVFRMNWIPCSARDNRDLCRGCPGSSVINHCTHFNKQVDQNVCKACGGVDAVTQRAALDAGPVGLLPDGILADNEYDLFAELPTVSTQSADYRQDQPMPYVHEDSVDVAMSKVPDRDSPEHLS